MIVFGMVAVCSGRRCFDIFIFRGRPDEASQIRGFLIQTYVGIENRKITAELPTTQALAEKTAATTAAAPTTLR
jgi:hypothetical protein